MAATRYRRSLKLCEEWPVEATKRGRDLGAFLRQRVAQAFREGESTQAREEDCMLLDKSAGWLAQGKSPALNPTQVSIGQKLSPSEAAAWSSTVLLNVVVCRPLLVCEPSAAGPRLGPPEGHGILMVV
ncbi:hypothetical protein KIL84_007408 [Mauremys mutica]|uniref:Mitochondrial nucleoid factor 1 n=1 Tax=Mauremys mutica TaxID=74926 RepID=A0A9D3X314_9SAUR|nr:hypothetical protein KIL84_007408 [Mauremys mutica]